VREPESSKRAGESAGRRKGDDNCTQLRRPLSTCRSVYPRQGRTRSSAEAVPSKRSHLFCSQKNHIAGSQQRGCVRKKFEEFGQERRLAGPGGLWGSRGPRHGPATGGGGKGGRGERSYTHEKNNKLREKRKTCRRRKKKSLKKLIPTGARYRSKEDSTGKEKLQTPRRNQKTRLSKQKKARPRPERVYGGVRNKRLNLKRKKEGRILCNQAPFERRMGGRKHKRVKRMASTTPRWSRKTRPHSQQPSYHSRNSKVCKLTYRLLSKQTRQERKHQKGFWERKGHGAVAKLMKIKKSPVATPPNPTESQGLKKRSRWDWV